MENIVILGGGGHAKVLIDLIRDSKDFEVIGILDSCLGTNTQVMGTPVLGNDDLLPQLYQKGTIHVCIGIGSVQDNTKRKKLYDVVKNIGFHVPSLVHQKSIVSKGVQISEGVQVMAGAIIQTGSIVGVNTIINTGAIIEHDCHISRNVHICPGTVVSGGCTIGESSFLGAGAMLIHGVEIGRNAIVAAGSVVINDISDDLTVMGVPAK